MKDVDDYGQSRNERLIRAFAEQFQPALRVCQTLKINNLQADDGWTCSIWNSEHSIGVTAVVHGPGLLHAFVEASGESDPDDAAKVGKAMAAALFGALGNGW